MRLMSTPLWWDNNWEEETERMNILQTYKHKANKNYLPHTTDWQLTAKNHHHACLLLTSSLVHLKRVLSYIWRDKGEIKEDWHFCAIFWILSWLWLVKALFQVIINNSAKQNTEANPKQFIWSEWFFNEWSMLLKIQCKQRRGAKSSKLRTQLFWLLITVSLFEIIISLKLVCFNAMRHISRIYKGCYNEDSSGISLSNNNLETRSGKNNSADKGAGHERADVI